MRAFQLLLVAMTVTLGIYTVIAGVEYGWNILPTIVDGIGSLTWVGQFHLDFACYLVLSALWLAWRHNFSRNGIILGLAASVLGIVFFAPYVLFHTFQSNGDMKVLLLGEARASV